MEKLQELFKADPHENQIPDYYFGDKVGLLVATICDLDEKIAEAQAKAKFDFPWVVPDDDPLADFGMSTHPWSAPEDKMILCLESQLKSFNDGEIYAGLNATITEDLRLKLMAILYFYREVAPAINNVSIRTLLKFDLITTQLIMTATHYALSMVPYTTRRNQDQGRRQGKGNQANHSRRLVIDAMERNGITFTGSTERRKQYTHKGSNRARSYVADLLSHGDKGVRLTSRHIAEILKEAEKGGFLKE